jgi:hypothetical protein
MGFLAVKKKTVEWKQWHFPPKTFRKSADFLTGYAVSTNDTSRLATAGDKENLFPRH